MYKSDICLSTNLIFVFKYKSDICLSTNLIIVFKYNSDICSCTAAALRNLNNNPEIFGSERRPIVDFSVENRKAIQEKIINDKAIRKVILVHLMSKFFFFY